MIRDVLSLDALRALAPDEAAALWAVRGSEADFSEQETAVFKQWLQLAPQHHDAWDCAAASLRLFEAAGDEDLLVAIRHHALAARPERSFAWQRWAAAVASITMVASVALLGIERRGLPDPPVQPRSIVVAARDPLTVLGSADYTTAKGEQRRVHLADGSLVVLDTDSAVDIAFTKSRRSIALLKGRVFFDVTRDADRPFAVVAGLRNIAAIGTRFDVGLFDSYVRVGLVSGRLAIATRGTATAPVIINTGQRFDDIGGAGKVTSPPNLEDVANWQRGYLSFDDDTLANAAAQFNRYGGAQLIVRNPGVAKLRVSGLFKAGDVGRFARTVAIVHPVKVVRLSPDSIEIQPVS